MNVEPGQRKNSFIIIWMSFFVPIDRLLLLVGWEFLKALLYKIQRRPISLGSPEWIQIKWKLTDTKWSIHYFQETTVKGSFKLWDGGFARGQIIHDTKYLFPIFLFNAMLIGRTYNALRVYYRCKNFQKCDRLCQWLCVNKSINRHTVGATAFLLSAALTSKWWLFNICRLRFIRDMSYMYRTMSTAEPRGIWANVSSPGRPHCQF